jgi:hypothetical protein
MADVLNDLERERLQIVEAMEWIDGERKRLARHCFTETRKKWHGEREQGRAITLMKKESEWLYRQRCRLRDRIGAVNEALKSARRAHSGAVAEGFGATFVAVARERLPADVFAAILEAAAQRHGGLPPPAAHALAAPARTVLDELKRDQEAFRASNVRPERAEPPGRPVRPDRLAQPEAPADDRETQADFGL